MRIKLFRKFFIALTFISTVTTVSLVTWKVVQKNNLEVESKTNNKVYKPVTINKEDYLKLIDYKNSSYVFNLKNAEYYLVHKTLGLYPELANKTFSFSVDSFNRPKAIELAISDNNDMKWFYSII